MAELHFFRLKARSPSPPDKVAQELGHALEIRFEHRVLDEALEGFFSEHFGFELSLFFHKTSDDKYSYRLNGIPFDQRSRIYDSESDLSTFMQRWLIHRGQSGWESMAAAAPEASQTDHG